MYRLRAATEADRDWLYELNRAAMRDYVVATWGEWNETFQRERFASSFAPERFQVIVVDGLDVGLLQVTRDAERIRLAEIELLPEHQSRGIGSEVIRDLIEEARAAALPLELQVLKVNPARALYERLGFAVYDETDTHHLMRAHPRPEPTSEGASQ